MFRQHCSIRMTFTRSNTHRSFDLQVRWGWDFAQSAFRHALRVSALVEWGCIMCWQHSSIRRHSLVLTRIHPVICRSTLNTVIIVSVKPSAHLHVNRMKSESLATCESAKSATWNNSRALVISVHQSSLDYGITLYTAPRWNAVLEGKFSTTRPGNCDSTTSVHECSHCRVSAGFLHAYCYCDLH